MMILSREDHVALLIWDHAFKSLGTISPTLLNQDSLRYCEHKIYLKKKYYMFISRSTETNQFSLKNALMIITTY